ncbi:hypothetical protein ACFV2X_22940 [Streptomyces sp. NPDC059679]|uniref:hypothetical protein n=1 Tax=Streptomyces sp. NPDC059679 TaxID=3346903 RepID=UPI0036B34905
MHDILLIALFAFLGAAAAGVLGACALLLTRRRSLITSLTVVAAVAVTALLAGTLSTWSTCAECTCWCSLSTAHVGCTSRE